MSKQVLILEDNSDRAAAMRMTLASVLPQYEITVFDNVTDWIGWASEHLAEVALICLDHDLGASRLRNGERFDPGIGREAADYLAGISPICPVIVHSSNAIAVPGMLRVLSDAGWPCSAVVPSDDLRWITREWREEIARYLAEGWIQV